MNHPTMNRPHTPITPLHDFVHIFLGFVVVQVFLALDARGFSAFDLAKDRKLLIKGSISGWILPLFIKYVWNNLCDISSNLDGEKRNMIHPEWFVWIYVGIYFCLKDLNRLERYI